MDNSRINHMMFLVCDDCLTNVHTTQPKDCGTRFQWHQDHEGAATESA